MIEINEDLIVNNEGLRVVEARPLSDKNKYIITLTYNDGKQYNFNVNSKEEKNEAFKKLADKKQVTTAKRQPKTK